MTPHPTPWTMETVTAGPARFLYHRKACGEAHEIRTEIEPLHLYREKPMLGIESHFRTMDLRGLNISLRSDCAISTDCHGGVGRF
jgi:hypothetical protein